MASINASTSGAGGVITTADASGVLNLQSGGVTMASVSSSGFNLGSGTPSTATALSPYTGFKNRIINGAMVIDQRNAGASVTVNDSSNARFPVDRTYGIGTTSAGVFTMQQSSTAPSGFTNSIINTVTTVDSSVTGADLYLIVQRIEGFNVADLGFGAAGALTVTLSFWVRSSVTGTFGGALNNGAQDRSYLFTYTINAANTWEQKSITIAGDTSGTWLKTNGIGLQLCLSLGMGTTYSSATTNSWLAGTFYAPSGATNLISNSGATFYITGVQLEVGSQATSFEYRDYGRELIMCQRYLPAYNATTASVQFAPAMGGFSSTTAASINYYFTVTPRVPPTGITVSSASHFNFSDNVTGSICNTLTYVYTGVNCVQLSATSAVASFAAYRPAFLYSGNASAQILFNGCEL